MLVAEKIGKSYKGRKIVKDVTLTIQAGKVIGLLGPNGAGKTTSFYIVAGLVIPDYGTVKLEKTNITKMPLYMRAQLGLSYLPQEPSIFRGMTVYENIMAACEMHEDITENQESNAEELMGDFGLSYLRNVKGAYLSGGERRRVEIARCLATKPKYILLDEPLAGIDPLAADEIIKLIQRLKKRGIGILITDHNVKDAIKILDYAYIMYDGKILTEGNVKTVIKDPKVKKLYLGEGFA